VCSAALISDASGRVRDLVGTLHGDIIELDVGNSDCAYGFETVAAITSSTVRTATCGGATFPTTGNGLAGVPVTLVTAAGVFDYNTIASNTSTVLTFTRPMSAAPTGTVLVGSIHAILESGRFGNRDPAHLKTFPFLRMFFEVGSGGYAYVSASGDQDDVAVVDAAGVDLTATDGEAEVMPSVEGRYLKLRVDVLAPGVSVRLLPMRIDVMSGEAAGV
jgi:hypothetical protein